MTITTEQTRNRRVLLAIGQFLIAIALMFRCNSMWLTLQGTEDFTKKIAYAMILSGILLSVLATGALRDTKRLILGVAGVGFFAVYLILYLFITDFAHKIFLREVIFFLALLLYYLLVENIDEIPLLLQKYEYVVTVVAVLSMVCWLLFSVIRVIPPTGEGMTWWNGTDHYTGVPSYFGIYYEPQGITLFGHYLIRNCAFFTEAPMASLHFAFAFMINVLLRKKVSLLRAILVGAAIITTFSMTGYLVAAVCVIVKLLLHLFQSSGYRNLKKTQQNLVKAGILLVIAALLVSCILVLAQKVGGVSWVVRMEDLKASFMAWLDKPVFGNGIYNFGAVKQHFPGSRATYAGFSCTTALGTILADGGLMFGVLYVGPVVCAVIKAVRERTFEIAVFALLVLLIFFLTIVPYEYIVFFVFLFLGLYRSRVYHHFADRL